MRRRRGQHRRQVLAVGVDGAGHERRLGAERQRDRVERVVDRAHRRGLGDLAGLRRRRVLPLRQAVDAVVEQHDRHVDVAAHRVDQVVAADRQRVAVTGDDPHREVRTRGLEAGGDGRGTSVDGVHAVGVRGSTGSGSSSRCPRRTRCSRGAGPGRAGPLHRAEDRVVAAAGTPADLLVAGELLGGLIAVDVGTPCRPRGSSIMAVSCGLVDVDDRAADQLRDLQRHALGPAGGRSASTRYLARSSIRAARGSSPARAPGRSGRGWRRGPAGTGSGGADGRAPRACPGGARPCRPRRWPELDAPADDEQLGVAAGSVDLRGRRCRRRCRSILPARSRTIARGSPARR